MFFLCFLPLNWLGYCEVCKKRVVLPWEWAGNPFKSTCGEEKPPGNTLLLRFKESTIEEGENRVGLPALE
jgi:hypothetical protein